MHPLDLVVLVADLDQHEALSALLSSRTQSLGIRPLTYQILKHPHRDPGCFHGAAAALQPYERRAAHALVVLDREGSGQENRTRGDIEADLERRLAAAGWADRARVVVIEPEVEAWVWSDSPQVDEVLGWDDRQPTLRDWLAQNRLWPSGQAKPGAPKDALRRALREVDVRPSGALFRQLGERVGLDRCQDASLARLREILVEWFGAAT